MTDRGPPSLVMALSKTHNWVSNAFQFRESPWLICYEDSKFTRGILADWWMTFQISCSFASLQLVGLRVFVWLPQRWWTWTFCEKQNETTLDKNPQQQLMWHLQWFQRSIQIQTCVVFQCFSHNSGSCHVVFVEFSSRFHQGYNLLCHSQGALVCRVAVQVMDHHRVVNFISLAGPQKLGQKTGFWLV